MIGIGLGVVSALGVAGQFASGLMSSRARQGEFAEQIRAMRMKRDQVLGTTAARQGAMGVNMGSVSTAEYLKALAGEFNREIAGVKDAAGTARKAGYVSLVAGALAGGAGIYGQIGALNNWWQKKGTE